MAPLPPPHVDPLRTIYQRCEGLPSTQAKQRGALMRSLPAIGRQAPHVACFIACFRKPRPKHRHSPESRRWCCHSHYRTEEVSEPLTLPATLPEPEPLTVAEPVPEPLALPDALPERRDDVSEPLTLPATLPEPEPLTVAEPVPDPLALPDALPAQPESAITAAAVSTPIDNLFIITISFHQKGRSTKDIVLTSNVPVMDLIREGFVVEVVL